MADPDWLDHKIGRFCKEIQKEIKDNPFLTPPIKQQFIDMLDDCASNAKDQEDKVGYINQELSKINVAVKSKSGEGLKKNHLA